MYTKYTKNNNYEEISDDDYSPTSDIFKKILGPGPQGPEGAEVKDGFRFQFCDISISCLSGCSRPPLTKIEVGYAILPRMFSKERNYVMPDFNL